MVWAASGGLSLDAALREAIAHNPELAQARLDLETAGWGVGAARAVHDPSLSLGVDLGQSVGTGAPRDQSVGWRASVTESLPTGGSASLSFSEDAAVEVGAPSTRDVGDGLSVGLDQPLLDGAGPLAARSGVRAAVRARRGGELAWRDALEGTVLDVSTAYWWLVASQEQRALAGRSLEIAEQELADTLEREAEGFAGSGDVLQVQRVVGTARQAALVADAQVDSAQAALARLLGRPLGERGVLEATDHPVIPEVSASLEESLSLARAANVGWLAAGLALETAADDLRLSRNAALPQLDVYGVVQLSGDGSDAATARDEVLSTEERAWAVGTELSVDIPGRAARATREMGALSHARAELALQAAEEDLHLAVEEAVRRVERDRSRVSLAEQTVAAAQALLDADRELLREGRGSTRDVVRSLESLDEAEAGLLSAHIDLQGAVLRLARVEGRLLGLVGLSAEP